MEMEITTKFNTFEEMEPLFIERGFVLDCFDAYARHSVIVTFRAINILLFVLFVIALCSFFYVDFSWKLLSIIVGVWLGLRVFTTHFLHMMLASVENFTVSCKKNTADTTFKMYYAHNDRLSDIDRKEIFTKFFSSRIGLVPK